MRLELIVAGLSLLGMLSLASDAFAQAKRAPNASCLAPASWYTLHDGEPRPANPRDLLASVAQRDVVLLGEQHDDIGHHQWQLQTLAALHLLRPEMVIGFESFPRRAQPALERWTAGESSVKQFLEETEWSRVWNFPPELYLPLFQFARINRIPMAALNVERSLTEAVRKKGWDAIPAEQKEGVSRPASASQSYQDFLFEVFQQHAGRGKRASRTDPEFRFFVESQITWDRAMAEALARRLAAAEQGSRPLVVGIMGSGHIRNGHGVPEQLRDLGVRNVSVLLPVNAGDCRDIKRGLADAVFAVPDAPRDGMPPPRLGVRLEEAGGEVRLAEVLSGSLAEKSGLERGDHIISVAGAPVTRIDSVVAAVRAQPAGTWLPMQVRRNQQTLEVVIKFPRQ